MTLLIVTYTVKHLQLTLWLTVVDTEVLPRSRSEMKGQLSQVLEVLLMIDSPQATKPSSMIASAEVNSLSQGHSTIPDGPHLMTDL